MNLRQRIERVLAMGGPTVARLGSAGTSVTFLVSDSNEPPLTLLLDREPPALSDDANAEVTIEFDAERAQAFAEGRLVVATCLMKGQARCSGPIRKYLAVDPILRSMLGRVHAGDEEQAQR